MSIRKILLQEFSSWRGTLKYIGLRLLELRKYNENKDR